MPSIGPMRPPDFWQADGIVPRLLDPAGRMFGWLGRSRRRLITARHAPVPVVCVGNLTVGGAGKTPTAIAIARRLQAMGRTPHFLTRGYGGRASGPLPVDRERHDAAAIGDEALLLAAVAPTWVARDRVAGALAAAKAGAELIVMDDGLQNPRLAHDLAMLVVDGAVGFGNCRLLPAGPLREKVDEGLTRVDGIVRIGADRVGVDALFPGNLPKLDAVLVPSAGYQDLTGQRFLAFAGIGRPTKFFETLECLGARLVGRRSFPDHHRYKVREIEALLEQARQVDAWCITTEKDHVRLPPTLGNRVVKLPVELRVHAPDLLDRLLSRVF